MTTSRYMLARIALAFGITRRQRRMAEAAAESHLLREAEQILGERIWNKVEEIEELGIEYWNLRRLVAEREDFEQKHEGAEVLLVEAHEQRAVLLSAKSEEQDKLEEKRAELLTELESLAKERDIIVTKAREVRRIYDGMKTKLDVLKGEQRDDQETIDRTHLRMTELREQFEQLKIDRDQLATKIENLDHSLDVIEKELESERKKHREEASEAFQLIGEANRKMASFKVELGIIETQMQQLFSEIGRHISRNATNNPHCRSAAKGNQSMVEVMRALRRSINFNHRLAGV